MSLAVEQLPSEKDLPSAADLEKHAAHATVESSPEYLNAHESVGLAVIEQRHIIPITGERKITTKKEYWAYVLWCKLVCNVPRLTCQSSSVKVSVSTGSRFRRAMLTPRRCRQLWIRGPTGLAQSRVPVWHCPLGWSRPPS